MPDKVVRLADVEDMLTNAQIISDGEYNGYCTEDIHLSMLPIADYAPVVNAHWVEGKGLCNPTCSVCNNYSPVGEYWTFCPWCGARMNEGEKQ